MHSDERNSTQVLVAEVRAEMAVRPERRRTYG